MFHNKYKFKKMFLFKKLEKEDIYDKMKKLEKKI